MRPRHAPPVLLALAMSACGGTWSDRDLEFAAALPARVELRSKLPAPTTSSQGLSQAGLNVGEPSKAYADTRSAQTTFNGFLDFFLGVLDTVRVTPPSRRTTDGRVWGPFPDLNNPGFEFEVEVRQVAERRFEWAMRARRVASGEELPIVSGAFEPTATLREGIGAMVVHLARFKDVLVVDEGMKVLDEIAIEYRTSQWPRQVAMSFRFEAGNPSAVSAIGYQYQEREDGSGGLVYQVRTTSLDATVLTTAAVWNAAGAGRGVSTVVEGRYQGFTVNECWNQAFRVVLYAESWPGGTVSGRPEDCPAVPE